MKRIMDIVVAVLAMLFLLPILAVVAIAVRLTSPGPILFRQQRVGKGFRPFDIYKFRSMVQEAPRQGGQITFGKDPRITSFGRILRKTKIDELPQLFNVLKGDMSLVGPRPEVPRYVNMFRSDYEIILQVRPGVTDIASIEYRDESTLLGQAEDPEREYVERVLPEKIRLGKEYVRRSSFCLDIAIILKTGLKLFADRVHCTRKASGSMQAGNRQDRATAD